VNGGNEIQKRSAVTVCMVALGALLACAKPSLYQRWDKQLADAPRHGARVDDVSLLLGSPPTHCEPVADTYPTIGIGLDPKEPTINAVLPGSPAGNAGLRVGDRISSIGGQPTGTPEETVRAIRQLAREGSPLEVGTNRGTFSPTPKVPKAEQCYWELHAGEVSRAGAAAYGNQWGGSAAGRAATYQRFFRASCRIHDGFVAGCVANWQE
jgi:hypothetical protein